MPGRRRSKPSVAAGLIALVLLAIPAAAPGQEDPRASDDGLPDHAVARLGSRAFQHLAPIGHIIYAPDGKTIISGSFDRTVRVWDAGSGEEARRWEPDGAAIALACSADGTRLVATTHRDYWVRSAGGNLTVWDPTTGKTVRSIDPGVAMPTWVDISRDGKRIAVAGWDGQQGCVAIVLEVETSARIAQISIGQTGWGMSILSPDGRRVLLSEFQTAMAIHDVESGDKLVDLEDSGPSQIWTPPVWSADGTTIVAAPANGVVRLWDTTTGKARWAAEVSEASFGAVAYSPDGGEVAATSSDGMLRVWDVAEGQPLREWRIASRQSTPSGTTFGASTGLAFSPDGQTIATGQGDHVVRLWNAGTGEEAFPHAGHTGHILSLDFSDDGRTLASGSSDGTVRLWGEGEWEEKLSATPIDAPLRSIDISPDGHLVAAAGEGGRVATIDAETGEPVGSWTVELAPDKEVPMGMARVAFVLGTQHVQTARFTPDGSGLLLGGAQAATYRVDLDSGKLRTLDPPESSEYAWAGGIIVVGGQQRPGRQPLMISLSQQGNPWGDAVALLLEGDFLVRKTAGAELSILDAATGERRHRIGGRQDGSLNPFVVDRDGSSFTTVAAPPGGAWFALGTTQGKVRLFESASGQEFAEISASRHLVCALAPSPDGRLLAVGTVQGEVRIYDAWTGKQVGLRGSHEEGVLALAFSPDGRLLASGGLDSFVVLWDVAGIAPGDPTPRIDDDRDDLEEAWQRLTSVDARAAFGAMRTLAGNPAIALPLIRDRIEIVEATSPAGIRQWIADLDHEDYDRREEASRLLARRGPGAEGVLREALGGAASPEAKIRLRKILRSLRPPHIGGGGETMRTLRALRVLERVGTPTARALLAELSGRSHSTWEKAAAAAGASRLGATPPPTSPPPEPPAETPRPRRRSRTF